MQRVGISGRWGTNHRLQNLFMLLETTKQVLRVVPNLKKCAIAHFFACPWHFEWSYFLTAVTLARAVNVHFSYVLRTSISTFWGAFRDATYEKWKKFDVFSREGWIPIFCSYVLGIFFVKRRRFKLCVTFHIHRVNRCSLPRILRIRILWCIFGVSLTIGCTFIMGATLKNSNRNNGGKGGCIRDI